MYSNSIVFKFLWVLYPVVVIFLILFSLGELSSGGAGKLEALVKKQDEAAVEEQKLNVLQQKLDILRQTDVKVESENLAWTTKAVPAGKEVWLMMAELNNAASVSGAVLSSYTGTVGDVVEATAAASVNDVPISLEVEFKVTDFAQLQKIISVLEKSLPLVSIAKVNFSNGSVKLSIVGAWSGWGKAASEALTPLPEYKDKLANLKIRLQEYATLPEVMVSFGSGQAVNPF